VIRPIVRCIAIVVQRVRRSRLRVSEMGFIANHTSWFCIDYIRDSLVPTLTHFPMHFVQLKIARIPSETQLKLMESVENLYKGC